jgi:hypothetical protein
VLPKREKRCRLILETLGAREMTASEITEELAAVPADNPAAGPEQMTLLGPGA